MKTRTSRQASPFYTSAYSEDRPDHAAASCKLGDTMPVSACKHRRHQSSSQQPLCKVH